MSQNTKQGRDSVQLEGIVNGTCWIGIDKELPKDGQKVDLWLQKHDITGKDEMRMTGCWYSKKHGFMRDDSVVKLGLGKYYSITHWMPVPAPPF